MRWFIFALLTAFSYGAYNFCIKLSSAHIHQVLGAVILQSVALLAGLICLVYLKATNVPVAVTRAGIAYAVLAGLFVGLAEILSFYFLSMGVSASRGIAIAIGGSVLVCALLGGTILREELSLWDWGAILLIALGITLLAAREH